MVILTRHLREILDVGNIAIQVHSITGDSVQLSVEGGDARDGGEVLTVRQRCERFPVEDAA